MTRKDVSRTGEVIAAWGGLGLAITGWLIAAKITGGRITVATLGNNKVMLSGNLIVILIYGIIHYVYSKFIGPQDYDFDQLDKDIHLIKQDMSGLTESEQVCVFLRLIPSLNTAVKFMYCFFLPF